MGTTLKSIAAFVIMSYCVYVTGRFVEETLQGVFSDRRNDHEND